MQPHSQSSPEQSNIEVNGERQLRLRFESLSHLGNTVDSMVSGFSEGRYGKIVDETKGLQNALEIVGTTVGQGDLAKGQTMLERAPRPVKLNEAVRDTLVELHQTEQGESTPNQQLNAVNGLLFEVRKEINTLTDPKKGNLHYTDPQVQVRKDIEAAFGQRHRDYFEDAQPENDTLQNGEERTSHDVANDAYDLILAYTEDKLQDPNTPVEKVEELRTARDTLHLERKGWKEQYDAQNEAVNAVMQMMGRDNEQFSETRVRTAIRGAVGDELSRLQELITVAAETTDPVERFNMLNAVQHERSPIQSAEAFTAWKQKRAEKAQAAEDQARTVMVDDARKTIEAIQSASEQPPDQAETVSAVSATPEIQEAQETLIAPVPTGWTELVHGTNSSRWQYAGETVKIAGSGLSVISLEDIARGAGRTTDNYSRTRTEDGQPIEVRVSFYRADLSPNLGVQPDATELKANLSKDTLALIAKYHQSRHPIIPRGETLLKIGESLNTDKGRLVEHYVPASVAEQYVEAVRRETGREIVLPSVDQPVASEQPHQQAITPNETSRPKQLLVETAPQAPETARDPYERFVKSALARVPQNVLLSSLTAIAQDRLMDGQQVDINTLRQSLGQRLDGSLDVEPAKLEVLAKRIQNNGFYESNGGIWQIQGSANTIQGRVAAEARQLVREILSEVI